MPYNSTQKPKKSNSILVLGAIFLAIVLPLIIGYIYLKLYQSGVNLGERNNGVLFEQTIGLDDLDIAFVSESFDEPKWILLQVFSHSCQNQCESRARLIGNIAAALGKYSHRVEPILFFDSESKNRFLKEYKLSNNESKQLALQTAENLTGQSSNGLKETTNHYPISQFEIDNTKLITVINQLKSALPQSDNDAIELFFIDPRGRFILGFKDRNSAKEIIRDMKILLKSSLIG